MSWYVKPYSYFHRLEYPSVHRSSLVNFQFIWINFEAPGIILREQVFIRIFIISTPEILLKHCQAVTVQKRLCRPSGLNPSPLLLVLATLYKANACASLSNVRLSLDAQHLHQGESRTFIRSGYYWFNQERLADSQLRYPITLVFPPRGFANFRHLSSDNSSICILLI